MIKRRAMIKRIAVLMVLSALTLGVCPAQATGQPFITQAWPRLALDDGGTLWGWGDNSTGALDDLGSGDRLDPWNGPYQTTPIKLLEGVAAACMGQYTLALKLDGTLWRRGQGEGWRQIMDGVAAIDQGGGSFAALKQDGSLWLWGDNQFGQLAPGGIQEESCETPVKVMDGVQSVSVDGLILAVKADGTLWSWGMDSCGALGTGGRGEVQGSWMPYRTEPVQILDHVTKAVAAGDHAFAIRTDGSLWAWGRNVCSELADPDLHNAEDESGVYIQTVPVRVMDHVYDVAAGSAAAYVLREDGVLLACGSNQFGQVGTGCAGEEEYVREPVPILDRVAQVSAWDCSAYAVRDDGTLWSWGSNGQGDLGYFGGDGYSSIGPQQTAPRQVLFGGGLPAPLEREICVRSDTVPVSIDGVLVAFPVLVSYDGNGGATTYVRLRDLAYALRGTRYDFNVEENAATEVTSLLLGQYVPVGGELEPPSVAPQTATLRRSVFGSSATRGVEYYHTITVTDADGTPQTYLRLRDLAVSYLFDVDWDGRQIQIQTDCWYRWSEVR